MRSVSIAKSCLEVYITKGYRTHPAHSIQHTAYSTQQYTVHSKHRHSTHSAQYKSCLEVYDINMYINKNRTQHSASSIQHTAHNRVYSPKLHIHVHTVPSAMYTVHRTEREVSAVQCMSVCMYVGMYVCKYRPLSTDVSRRRHPSCCDSRTPLRGDATLHRAACACRPEEAIKPKPKTLTLPQRLTAVSATPAAVSWQP